MIDTGFLLLYYSGSANVKPYFNRILSGGAIGFISEVNLAEFFYKVGNVKGIEVADVWYHQIRQADFELVAPDETITRDAALWKIRNGLLSLADCFALATMKEAQKSCSRLTLISM